jgi:hypothetical protein
VIPPRARLIAALFALLAGCAASPTRADGGPSADGAAADAAADAGIDGGRARDGGAGCLTLTFAIDATPLGAEVWSLAVADLDGDGNLDALATVAGSVTFLRGDGHGHLAAAGVVAGLEADGQLVLGDVDGDGRPDIVAPRPTMSATAAVTPGVDVFLNRGGGTFGAAVSSLSTTPIAVVALAHVDADARLDLVFADADPTATHLRVALGAGDGTFGAGADLGAIGPQPDIALGPARPGLAVLDLDGDGRDDVVAGLGDLQATGAGGVGVWLNDGTPSMRAGPKVALPATPQGLFAGDVDGDRRRDVVASADQIYVLRGTGAAAGALGLIVPPPLASGRSPSLAIGDVDGDGRDDVAFVQGIDVGFAAVAHATAGGSFDALFMFEIGHQPTFAASGDFDGDGAADVLAATRDSHDVVLLLSRPSPTGSPDERSCSLCPGSSSAGLPSQDHCQALP